ncbi:hypothetical protein ES703_45068 [subsurface metagenome]
MAYSKGGITTNLIEGYRLGEDDSYSYGNNRHLAQTFSLNQLYAVWRCLFKQWTNQGDKFYHYAIKATDATGKPTGADIVHTTLSPTGEEFHSPGKWRRFDFDEFPLLGPGIYALVASVPDAFANWRYKLRCDATAPTYADGKAWVSNDDGSSWTEIPNTDFMFEVWGYAPPPDPPPPPSISNWAVPAIDLEDLLDGVIIKVTTDIPCHLYMRWTTTKPEVHNIQVYRRGLAIRLDKRFCFVTWHENEQEEEGDTYIHTFTKKGWPSCETRWFYFVGTVAQEQQPSTSPIFSYHFIAMEYSKFHCTCSTILSGICDCEAGDWRGAPFWQLNNTYVGAGRWGTDYEKLGCGMRFGNVLIPPGSTILKACLRFRAMSSQGEQYIKTWLRGQKSANPGAFTTEANYYGRPRTTGQIDWSPIETWLLPNFYFSPDIATLIQEIIDLPAWAEGNTLVIFWDDHDDRTTVGGSNSRLAYSLAGLAGSGPVLSVLYHHE